MLVTSMYTGAASALRHLGYSNEQLSRSTERLSSGLRINRAADDAAGLHISEAMRTQHRGMNQAQMNAHQGISVIQIADGALTEVHAMLQRIRVLAVQSSNDTHQDADRRVIQDEVDQLVRQINTVATLTQYNGMTLLDGTFANKRLQIGANINQTMAINIPGARSTDIGLDTPKGYAVKEHWADHPGHLPAHTPKDPLAPSKPFDDWYAGEPEATMTSWSETFTQSGVFTVTNGTVLDDGGTQVGILVGDDRLEFSDGSWAEFDNPIWQDNHMPDPKQATIHLTSKGVSVETRELAQLAIGQADDAIANVSDIRSTLGALQNRLTHTIANLGVAAENLTAAEARIRDADIATEWVEYTRAGMLSQLGISMASHARSMDSALLPLLA